MPNWREPLTRGFSLYKNPGDFSCDNSPLFSVVAEQLGLITSGELELIIVQYESKQYPGVLLRHPSQPSNFNAWDCHLAACVGSQVFAIRCLRAMRFWAWRTPTGNVIGRTPLLPVTMKAAAGEELSAWDTAVACFVLLANTREKREETSGKQLCWLAHRILRTQGPLLRRVCMYWEERMQEKYPGGLREMLAIYYREPGHPFISAARSDFF